MPFEVKILKDSISPLKHRLTTFELTYPRFIHSELLTHRQFSKNSASSRAIPVEKLIQRVLEDPVIPIHWGKNQKGMQAGEEIDEESILDAEGCWYQARDEAVMRAKDLLSLGIHKQIVNRLIEPFMFITVILSSTEEGLNNFFNLRRHKDAEPHIFKLADMMWQAYAESKPNELFAGDYHLPLIGFPGDEALGLGDQIKVSIGRCARVSYLTHNGTRDTQADIELYHRLEESGHFSPFEHVATPYAFHYYHGNFQGWTQVRKLLPGEFKKEYNA